jgi:hypothetical protein
MELYLPSAQDRGDDANQVLRGSGAGFGKAHEGRPSPLLLLLHRFDYH